MKTLIAKEFIFHASHQLPAQDCYGKCSYLHGHTYKLIVEVSGEINEEGWLLNFKELKSIVEENVIDVLDHSHLNETTGLEVTTAENIILWIFNKLKDKMPEGILINSVILYETPTSYAKLTL